MNSTKKSGLYIPCRALLDGATKSKFITERCVQGLWFSKIQTRSSIQGISNSIAVVNHCVSVHMKSRHTDWHDSVNCAAFSDITGATQATKLDTSSSGIPTDIKLAVDNFILPGDIDLSLGAEHFYEILRSGRRTRPGHPLLQELVLAWTLTAITQVITSQWLITVLLLREDTSLENNPNRFCDLEALQQTSMTAEQQDCEKHFITHVTHTLIEVLFLDFHKFGSYAAWIFSPLCKTKTACNWMQAETKSRLQISVSQLHESIWRTRSHGTSEIPTGEKNMLYPSKLFSFQRNK